MRLSRRTTSLTALVSTAAVLGAGLTMAASASGAAPNETLVKSLPVVADTYLDAANIKRSTGSATKLVASLESGKTKVALLKFTVPATPDGYRRTSAKVLLNIVRSTSTRVDLAGTAATWSEASVTYRDRPASSGNGRPVASAAVQARQTSVSLDVTTAVPATGSVSFAVTVPSGTTAVVAKEAGPATAARLVVSYTRTPTPKPTTATPTVPRGSVKIGMSSPATEWDVRLGETGGVDSRRIFSQLGSTASAVKLARSELAAGRLPILSFKVPNNDWAGVGRGDYDTQLRQLTRQLATLGGRVFVTLHHEPSGDGTPTDYAAMLRHALPILGAPAHVDAGPIVNGFWWSNGSQGLIDSEIAQWLPADVLTVSEVVAADTYHGGTVAKPGENAAVKIRNMSSWADRVGVKRLGIGEYNGLDAAAVRAAGDAILSDHRFVFAAIFNSDVNNRTGVSWTLSGDRLTAFQHTVAKSRTLR